MQKYAIIINNMNRICTKTYGSLAKNVWIVIPFSKPEFMENTILNILRQTKKDKVKVCVVENGEGIGSCKSAGFVPDLLLTSEKHQSIAKNTALEEINKVGGQFWTTFDCDDYYGKFYIEELLDNSNCGDIIGKCRIFIKPSTNDKIWLVNNLPEHQFVPYIHGPTISGWVDQFMEFPIIPYAEDMRWVEEMQNRGAITYATSCYNFCYNRFDYGHTFKITDNQLLENAKSVEEFVIDYEIVNKYIQK